MGQAVSTAQPQRRGTASLTTINIWSYVADGAVATPATEEDCHRPHGVLGTHGAAHGVWGDRRSRARELLRTTPQQFQSR